MWTKMYKNVNSFSNRTTSSPQQFGTCVEQNTKYRKCRNPHVHATNCTLSKNCATSCAKKFNSVWTRPVSTLSKWDLVTVRCIICMQHVQRDAYMILPLSLSFYVSKLAFSFIYTASLEAFRARGRVRITLFDKVARAAWFNETFNCTRAIVLTTGRFTPLLRASRTGKWWSLKTVINDGDNHVALQTEIEFPLSNFFGRVDYIKRVFFPLRKGEETHLNRLSGICKNVSS